MLLISCLKYVGKDIDFSLIRYTIRNRCSIRDRYSIEYSLYVSMSLGISVPPFGISIEFCCSNLKVIPTPYDYEVNVGNHCTQGTI